MWGATNWVGPSTEGVSRAQTAPLAVILVFGMVIVGSTLVVLVGGHAISETQGTLQSEQSENALTQFDSEIAMVALGGTDTKTVDLGDGLQSGYRLDESAGRLTVRSSKHGVIMDEDLGSFGTSSGSTEIAYQGGGVWRYDSEGSVMVSPPEFHYRNGTLTLPLVTLSEEQSIEDRVSITKGSSTQHYPSSSNENPLENGRVEVTVQSKYYEAWGAYFEERTEGEVKYDHANDETILTLVVPAKYPSVKGGLVSGASGAKFDVKNQGKIDSYNSSEQPYSTGATKPADTNSKVVVAGDMKIHNNADVYGDVEVGGDFIIKNDKGTIHNGNVSYGGSAYDTKSGDPWQDNWVGTSPVHSENDNASVDTPDPMGSIIDERLAAVADPNNGNDGEDTIDESANEIDCAAAPDCRIEAGTYYLDTMDVDNDLELDTTSGDITIVVDGHVDLDADIRVTGPGRVNIYVEKDVEFAHSARVLNSDDDATQFWLYMNPDRMVTMNNWAELRGVIFGPNSPTKDGVEVELDNHAEIWGGVVGTVDIQSNHVWIHYDESLAEAESVERDTKLPALTYLHISENEVEVKGS